MADHDLAAIVSLTEFEHVARAAMDPVAFDYIAGGSWDESSLARNLAAWRDHVLRPRVLTGTAEADPASSMLRTPVAMPVAIAPMAAHGLAHADGESATARAAAAAGVPFIQSTMSTCSIEEVAASAPDAIRWFQLYVQADPGRSRALVERAAAAGDGAIVVTADLPRLGYRERDRRNGFELGVPLGNFSDAPPTHRDHGTSGFERLDRPQHVALAWTDLATIRSWSSLPLVLKGVLTGEDARLAVEHGVDALVVSNHGGRQLDRTPAPIDVLEEVVAAVDGRVEVWVDGGVRSGLDIVIARALGARGVLVGRPILWALAADGQAGVERALAILREEFVIAMTLLGVADPDSIVRAHVAPSTARMERA